MSVPTDAAVAQVPTYEDEAKPADDRADDGQRLVHRDVVDQAGPRRVGHGVVRRALACTEHGRQAGDGRYRYRRDLRGTEERHSVRVSDNSCGGEGSVIFYLGRKRQSSRLLREVVGRGQGRHVRRIPLPVHRPAFFIRGRRGTGIGIVAAARVVLTTAFPESVALSQCRIPPDRSRRAAQKKSVRHRHKATGRPWAPPSRCFARGRSRRSGRCAFPSPQSCAGLSNHA